MFHTRIFAQFFDGTSARSLTVTVQEVAHQGAPALRIEPEGMPPIYWPTADLREMSDQTQQQDIILQLHGDDLARLVIPAGKAEDLIRQISPNLGKRTVSKPMIRRLVFWAGGAVASVLIIMFVILPAMSDQLAKMIPPAREAALGKATLKQIEKYMLHSQKSLTCSNPAGVAALDKMIARVTAGADIPYDLNVQVFDHKLVNAFAVPGGNVVLFDGLLKIADSPEEVAGVLAHEIGHVVKRDPTRLTLRSAGSAGILGMVFGDFAGGFAALVITERLINASYAQDAESGADTYAHGAMRTAGLPSAPLGDFFMKLKKKHGDNTGLLSHLASHPDLQGRAKAARDASTVSSDSFEAVLNGAEWQALQGICS